MSGTTSKPSHDLLFPRRLGNLTSVNQLMRAYLADHIGDTLAEIEELKNWHLFAADGHYHKAAIFDPKTKADHSRRDPAKSSTGHFFRLDLRTLAAVTRTFFGSMRSGIRLHWQPPPCEAWPLSIDTRRAAIVMHIFLTAPASEFAAPPARSAGGKLAMYL